MSASNYKFFIFLLFTTLIYGVLELSFYETSMNDIEIRKENLVTQADLHYDDIINTRAWNADLGGVYAYSEKYKPNPYLKNNTIKDSNGKQMIKINPAWMTRMLSERSNSKEYKFYLKSNKPVNPLNKAGGFYAKSLKELEQSSETDNSKRYRFVEKNQKLEYIKALYLKQACTNCHDKKDDFIGSLRGGVVIEIHSPSYFNNVKEIYEEFYEISAIVTFLFILLVIIVYKFIKRTNEVEQLNSNLLHQSGKYLNTLFDNNPNIIIVTNGGKILKTNKAFFLFFNEYNSLDTFLKEYDCICQFFETGDDPNFITNVKNEWIKDALNKEQPIAKITHQSKTHYFLVAAKKIFEEKEMHYMVTFNDITETYNLKKEFEVLSITDTLTGLNNRRYFNEIFINETNRAKRDNYSLTFLIIDIDFFKLYNDNYGHDAGDVLLQKLSKELLRLLKRSNEFVFRLGGEEFGVIYSGLSHKESLSHAQYICDSIKDINLEHTFNKPFEVLTISIGHFYADKTETLEPTLMYHNADIALYYAKEHGRNQVKDYNDISLLHENRKPIS
jgi:diguanylate cyclase (GGDEF)-like protein